MLMDHDLMRAMDQMKHLVITDPLSYIDSVAIMASAKIVPTDSGGIQEETTVLGIPCLTLRNNTERPVTVTEGTNELVGNSPELIVASAIEVLRTGGKKGRIPEMWDGKASERILGDTAKRFCGTGLKCA